MYGTIGESRLLNVEVYRDEELIYKGRVEDAPNEVKNTNYKSVQIDNDWVIYNV